MVQGALQVGFIVDPTHPKEAVSVWYVVLGDIFAINGVSNFQEGLLDRVHAPGGTDRIELILHHSETGPI